MSKVVHSDTDMLSNLCKYTQLVSGRARIWPRYGVI